jgi:hypothetical protein
MTAFLQPELDIYTSVLQAPRPNFGQNLTGDYVATEPPPPAKKKT